jgi:hypothetical protein
MLMQQRFSETNSAKPAHLPGSPIARITATAIVLSFACMSLVGITLAIWPKGLVELLIGTDDWRVDGRFDSLPVGVTNKLEIPVEVLKSPRMRLWRSSLSAAPGTTNTLLSNPFDPPPYLGIPHHGFPGEVAGNRIFLRCTTNGREIDIANILTNTQWATAYLSISPRFCGGQVQLGATVVDPRFYIGVGTPFAVSSALYYAQTAFPTKALVVFGTWLLALIIIAVIAYVADRLRPGIEVFATGFVGLGVVAIIVFIVFHFSPTAGRLLSSCIVAGGAGALVWVSIFDRAGLYRLRAQNGTAALCWLAVAMTYAAFVSSIDNGGGSWAINGMFSPLRWSSDNQLPFLFADAMYGRTPREKIVWGPWLASDRTPLLAALLLIVRSVLIAPLSWGAGSTIIPSAYVLAAIVIMSSWTPAFYRFCRQIDGVDERLVIALAVTSPFFFFNTVYIWPKMLGAIFVLWAALLLVRMRTAHTTNPGDLVLVTLCASLSYLSHGSNAFALISLLLIFAPTILHQGMVRIGVAIGAAIAVVLPWLWWQAFVQPGGNALIRSALAGDFGFEKRNVSLLISIRDAYQQLGFEGWLASKMQAVRLMVGLLDVRSIAAPSHSPGLGPLGFARMEDFFILARSVGIAGLGLPLLLGVALYRRVVGGTHSHEACCLAFAGLGGVIVAFLILLPFQVTHVHAYGAIALLFLAGAIAMVQISRPLMLCIVALSILYFSVVWIVHPLWTALRIDWMALLAFFLGCVALAAILMHRNFVRE